MKTDVARPDENVRAFSIQNDLPLPLPPLPSAEDRFLDYEVFSVPGWEAVNVLRPAYAEYRTTEREAPALVLVPGLGMDCRGYIKQLPLGAVADLHMLQAMNAPINGEEGLGHFARQVEEYILQRELDKRPGGFVIGGSSMGGSVSLHVCLRERVKPRALLLLGSFANAAHLPFYQRTLAPLARYLPIDMARRLGRSIASRFDKVWGFRGQEVRWMVGEDMRPSIDYYERAIMALTRQNQIPQARGLRLPTLVVHGTDDWVLPHAAGVEMAQAIPGANFISIPGAGHGVFFTHATQVNAEIAAFIRRL